MVRLIEMWFFLGNHGRCVLQTRKRDLLTCFQHSAQRPASLTVWKRISAYEMDSLHIWTGPINAEGFIQVLEQHMLRQEWDIPLTKLQLVSSILWRLGLGHTSVAPRVVLCAVPPENAGKIYLLYCSNRNLHGNPKWSAVCQCWRWLLQYPVRTDYISINGNYTHTHTICVFFVWVVEAWGMVVDLLHEPGSAECY